MKWKDGDVDFTKNCIFIDKAGFNINMRFNWAIYVSRICAVVKTLKIKSASYTARGAIHSTTILHIALKKPNKQENQIKQRRLNKGEKRASNEIDDERYDKVNKEPSEDYAKVFRNTATFHFVKFINELLEIMGKDETLKTPTL